MSFIISIINYSIIIIIIIIINIYKIGHKLGPRSHWPARCYIAVLAPKLSSPELCHRLRETDLVIMATKLTYIVSSGALNSTHYYMATKT